MLIRKDDGTIQEKTILSQSKWRFCQRDIYSKKGLRPRVIHEFVLVRCRTRKRTVTVPLGVQGIGYGVFEANFRVHQVHLPPTLRVIGNHAFDGCTDLKTLTVPEGVEDIGEYAFRDCIDLKEVWLPSTLLRIGACAFEGCASLEKIHFAGGVYHIDKYAFLRCESVRLIELPEGTTVLGEQAFAGCKKLERIALPDSLTEIGERCFAGCTSLNSVSIPQCFVRKEAFSGCTALEQADYRDGSTGTGEHAFRMCRSLRRVAMPASMQTIGSYAFYCCASLQEVVFRGGLKYISANAFDGCISLRSVHLPEGTDYIDNNAFAGCTSLADITVPKSLRSVGTAIFDDTPWLKQQKDSFILIGDGILLRYTGSGPTVRIPREARHINSDTFKDATASIRSLIIHEDIQTFRAGFDHEIRFVFELGSRSASIRITPCFTSVFGVTVNPECTSLISFWTSGRRFSAFTMIHDPEIAYPLASLIYLSDPENRFYSEYVERNSLGILRNRIEAGDSAALYEYTERGFVTEENIDELISLAVASGQKTGFAEPQAILTSYKKRNIGYASQEQIFDRMAL